MTQKENDQEPPPPPFEKKSEITREQQVLEDFDQLLEQFGEQLNRLRDAGFFVVFELDLDDTMVQDLRRERDFSYDKAHKLESKRMEKFSAFAQRFADMFFLVYNTARTPTGTFPIGSQQRFREISVEATETFDGGQGQGMVFNDLNKAHTRWLLPVPDVLIMAHGGVVSSGGLTTETGLLTSDECFRLSETLSEWLESDKADFEKIIPYLRAHFADTGYNSYHSNLSFELPVIPLARLDIQKDVDRFHRDWPGNSAAFVPVMDRIKCVAKVRVSLASVNKGSTFRLVIEKIITKRRALGKSAKAMVFVFGDSPMDLPMLRPDLEIKAFEPINDSAMVQRDARFQAEGVQPLNRNNFSWWELSIIPKGSKLGKGECCGPYVDRVLNHAKIKKSTGWGIASLIKTVVTHLNR